MYHKGFVSLGLQAVVTFSGNGLPEENRDVALRSLSVRRLPSGDSPTWSHQSTKVHLGELPEVLVSELYSDMRQFAAAGTGYNPEWEQKVDE